MSSVAYIDDIQQFFSDDVDPALAHHLNQATRTQNPQAKETLLIDAIKQWPQALDAYVALYKFYFRQGAYQKAERTVWACLMEAARQGGFNRNYRLAKPGQVDWLGDRSVARMYLFSLKALGVIRLRQQKIMVAKAALGKVLDLDPQDEIGAATFLAIAESFDGDDED